MELTCWRITFLNGQEYCVESEVSKREEFLKLLEAKGIFTKGLGYITLQKGQEAELLDIRSDKIFSIQKARSGSIAAQTKKWSLV